MKRLGRIVGVSTLGAAATVVVAGAWAATAWSQATQPAAPATPSVTQPQSSQQSQQSQPSGEREFRDLRERRFEGRPGGGGGSGGGGGGGDDMRGRGEWTRREMRADPFAEVMPEEWKQIEEFMKKHSPERLKRLEDIGDESRQQGVKNMFAARYRFMQELKERDEELYKIRLERLPIEDKAFELSWQLMRSKQAEKSEETKKLLRAELRKLVKSRLEERALHLRQMERRLTEEEARIDEIVKATMSDLEDERLPRDLRPPPFGVRRERREDEGTSSSPTNATE